MREENSSQAYISVSQSTELIAVVIRCLWSSSLVDCHGVFSVLNGCHTIKHRITTETDSVDWRMLICIWEEASSRITVATLQVVATLSTCKTENKHWLWVKTWDFAGVFYCLSLLKYCKMKLVHSFWILLYNDWLTDRQIDKWIDK